LTGVEARRLSQVRPQYFDAICDPVSNQAS
jgi:hypothetical protein